MKLLLLVLCATVALAAVHLPRMRSRHQDLYQKRQKDDPDCGLYAKKTIKIHKSNDKVDFMCEMCYDLDTIFQQYADCDEAYQDKKGCEGCDTKYGNGTVMDQMCRSIVNELYDELRNDTDQDPDAVCSVLMKRNCTGTTYTYVL